jgi:hypothetical protein
MKDCIRWSSSLVLRIFDCSAVVLVRAYWEGSVLLGWFKPVILPVVRWCHDEVETGQCLHII